MAAGVTRGQALRNTTNFLMSLSAASRLSTAAAIRLGWARTWSRLVQGSESARRALAGGSHPARRHHGTALASADGAAAASPGLRSHAPRLPRRPRSSARRSLTSVAPGPWYFPMRNETSRPVRSLATADSRTSMACARLAVTD
jgi:hypothetical protein